MVRDQTHNLHYKVEALPSHCAGLMKELYMKFH